MEFTSVWTGELVQTLAQTSGFAPNAFALDVQSSSHQEQYPKLSGFSHNQAFYAPQSLTTGLWPGARRSSSVFSSLISRLETPWPAYSNSRCTYVLRTQPAKCSLANSSLS